MSEQEIILKLTALYIRQIKHASQCTYIDDLKQHQQQILGITWAFQALGLDWDSSSVSLVKKQEKK